MYLGMITKVFHDLTLAEALDEIGSLGVRAVELGTGNYNGDAHCPVEELLADGARHAVEFLRQCLLTEPRPKPGGRNDNGKDGMGDG